MKNLKRVLSLALTGTMLAGMMTIGASAANKDFTDADEIQHTEAVNVMSTLGVLKGKDTGAFDPNTTVTRAEMAKIICVMLNGGNDPTLGSASSAMFSDINGHWARSYIEYCASMNIIAGQGDGTFAPDAPVTGAAAAKMLLVAMGYDSSIFEFTGADWEINVNRRANEAKLYEEIKNIDTSVGLSRDNTAQMAYNALEAKIMETTYDKVISSGEVSWSYGLSNETFLNKYFDAYTWVGTFTGNYNTGAAGTKGYIAVSGKLDTADEKVSNTKAQFPYDFDIANIGEEVKVIFKDGKSGSKNQPDKNDTIYGVFNTGRTEVITATKGDVKDNKTTKAQVNIDGTKYDAKDTVDVIINYGLDTKEDLSSKGTASANSALTTALQAKTGDTIKAVTDPEDGKIMTVYVTESKIAAVTAKNSDKVSMNNGVGAIDVEDNDIYEDIKKGDVVIVTTLYANVDEDLSRTIVEPAEKITGEVRGYKDQTNVKLGSDTYKIHGAANMLNAIPNETVTTAFDGDDIGEEFDLYMINGYVGAAVMVSEAATNYSVVTAVKAKGSTGGVFNSLELQVMDTEGNKSIITVGDNSKDIDGNKATTADSYNVGDIVVWSGKATDATVTVKASYKTPGTADYVQKTKAFDGAVTTANCVLFAETSNVDIANTEVGKDNGNYKFKVYNIRDLDSLENISCTYVLNGDKKVVAVFADLDKNAPGATDSTVYGIVTGYAGTTKQDGTSYYEYTVKNNEEEFTLLFTAKQADFTGKLVSFEPVSDNVYSAEDILVFAKPFADDNYDLADVYVKELNEGDKTLTFFGETKKVDKDSYEGVEDSQSTYALDDDCTIVYVNAEDGELGRDIGVNGFDSVTNHRNAAIVTSTDTKGNKVIVAIFVETSNKVNILK